jgi:hypothetical protein
MIYLHVFLPQWVPRTTRKRYESLANTERLPRRARNLHEASKRQVGESKSCCGFSPGKHYFRDPIALSKHISPVSSSKNAIRGLFGSPTRVQNILQEFDCRRDEHNENMARSHRFLYIEGSGWGSNSSKGTVYAASLPYRGNAARRHSHPCFGNSLHFRCSLGPGIVYEAP